MSYWIQIHWKLNPKSNFSQIISFKVFHKYRIISTLIIFYEAIQKHSFSNIEWKFVWSFTIISNFQLWSLCPSKIFDNNYIYLSVDNFLCFFRYCLFKNISLQYLQLYDKFNIPSWNILYFTVIKVLQFHWTSVHMLLCNLQFFW